ncbi:MAG: hypothetical protein R2788_17830 [Saprospiraceae bacterium]
MKEQLNERGLDKRSTPEMVILCRNGKGYEQLLLGEYLAYKLYNLLMITASRFSWLRSNTRI